MTARLTFSRSDGQGISNEFERLQFQSHGTFGFPESPAVLIDEVEWAYSLGVLATCRRGRREYKVFLPGGNRVVALIQDRVKILKTEHESCV